MTCSYPHSLASTLITSTSSLLIVVDDLLVREHLLLLDFLQIPSFLTNRPHLTFKKHFQVLTLMTSSYLSALIPYFLCKIFFLGPSLKERSSPWFSTREAFFLSHLSALSIGTSSLYEWTYMAPGQLLLFPTRELYLVVVLATFNPWIQNETHFLFPSQPPQP